MSALFAGGIQGRIWDSLEAPPLALSEIPPGVSYMDYLRQLSPRDKPYAVFLDQQLSLVSEGMGILVFPTLIVATQDRSRAEAIAYAFGAPVERWVSDELDSQPVLDISLVQLIANPNAWIGKRVSVQGYLSPLHVLYLTHEHADALDYDSSVQLLPRLSEEAPNPLAACEGKWVSVEGFVHSDRGMTELTRLERVYSKDTKCWPLPSEAK